MQEITLFLHCSKLFNFTPEDLQNWPELNWWWSVLWPVTDSLESTDFLDLLLSNTLSGAAKDHKLMGAPETGDTFIELEPDVEV